MQTLLSCLKAFKKKICQTEDFCVPDLLSSLAINTVLFPPAFTTPGLSSGARSGLRVSVPGEFSSKGFPLLPGDDLESSGSTIGETEDPRLCGGSPPAEDDPVVSGQGDNGKGFFCACVRDKPDGATWPHSGWPWLADVSSTTPALRLLTHRPGSNDFETNLVSCSISESG